MCPHPPLFVKIWWGYWRYGGGGGGGVPKGTWREGGGWGVGGMAGGGAFPMGGLLDHHTIPSLLNFSRSCAAMVCLWAVQREQNRDQRHSTTFKESRTRTKHIVPPSTKHAKKKKKETSAPLAPWPLHHYLSKLEGGGGEYKDWARPPPEGTLGYVTCALAATAQSAERKWARQWPIRP